jgi:hypothetical protein
MDAPRNSYNEETPRLMTPKLNDDNLPETRTNSPTTGFLPYPPTRHQAGRGDIDVGLPRGEHHILAGREL